MDLVYIRHLGIHVHACFFVFLKTFVTDLRSEFRWDWINFIHLSMLWKSLKVLKMCSTVQPLVLRLCHISSFLIRLYVNCAVLKKKERKERKWHNFNACKPFFSTSVNVQPWLQCLVYVYILPLWPPVSIWVPALAVCLKMPAQ